MTAHKSIVLYPFIAIVFYSIAVSNNPYQNLTIIFIFLYASLCVAGELKSYMAFDLYASFIGRRGLFLPNIITDYYVTHFNEHPMFLWANSKVTFGLVENSYDLKLSRVIGYHYFGNEHTAANTGWIGSGFAHARIAGVIVYSLVLGLLISVIGVFSRQLPKGMVISSMSVVWVTSVVSADLTTVILTHGLLIGILLLILQRTRFA